VSVDCFYEGANLLAIPPGECVDCDNCRPACPTNAIFAEADVPAKWQDFIQLNAVLSQSGRPNITQQKECMGHLDDGKSRRDLLDEAPFAGG
jgi:ferredoxin